MDNKAGKRLVRVVVFVVHWCTGTFVVDFCATLRSAVVVSDNSCWLSVHAASFNDRPANFYSFSVAVIVLWHVHIFCVRTGVCAMVVRISGDSCT